MIHVFVISSVMVEILFFLFLVIQTLIWAQTNGDPTVTCVFRQNCTLPCNVDPSSDTIIHWDLLTSGEHNVHSYYDTKDQLGRQDQQFKGRTSLFQDLISRGNGSLMLTGVKIQDEGRYSCYSSTERGSRKTFIQLKVEVLIKVIIKELENRLICSSERIYLKPELMWSVNPPSKLKLYSPTMVHQTEEQLYNISSSLLVFDSLYDLTYSCTVSGGRNRTTASFLKRKKVMDTQSKVASVIFAITLGTSPVWVTAIIGYVCYGRTKKNCCNRAVHQQSNRAANQQIDGSKLKKLWNLQESFFDQELS